tara:strand:+ start:16401 stop:17657 length:1257 start_codon:yes stop_codon:yes gene_type:complete
MKVLIFQSGEPLHIDPNNRPMRGINLANKFVEKGHKVLVISSRFDHYRKKKRVCKSLIRVNQNLEILLLNSPGYKKNISIARLWDHAFLALNLLHKLLSKKIPKQDLFILGFPPIETSFVLILWSKLKKIPAIIDIKDLWPEIFISRLPQKISMIVKILIYPYKLMSIYAIKNADITSSISPSFLNWSQKYSKRISKQNDFVAPLVSPIINLSSEEINSSLNWWKTKGINFNNKTTFCFIGTLSIAYDFKEISKAVKLLEKKNKFFQIIICGEGTVAKEIKFLFKNCQNVYFPGWVDSNNAFVLRKYSRASIAPYINTEDFMKSIPNKIIDSLSYKLPIISTLKGEVKNLLKKDECGIYIENNYLSWERAFENIIFSDKIHKKLKDNCEKIFLEKFEFNKNYNRFLINSEKLVYFKSL